MSHQPDNIFAGTPVVSLVEVRGTNDSLVHPRVRTKKRLGVYAGSFDPLTVGHLWMTEQGVALFDRLVVAIGINPEKRYTFSLEWQWVGLWPTA